MKTVFNHAKPKPSYDIIGVSSETFALIRRGAIEGLVAAMMEHYAFPSMQTRTYRERAKVLAMGLGCEVWSGEEHVKLAALTFRRRIRMQLTMGDKTRNILHRARTI